MQALFDFLTRIIETVKPWYTINPWEAGIRIRMGKYVKVLTPGVHFQIPLVDNCHSLNVVPRVVNLPHQSLKTSDGKNLALSAALAYTISDVEKVFIEVDDHDESLINLTMGLLADYVANHPIADCGHDAIQASVASSVRDAVEPWGIDIMHVYLTDLSDVKTFRLMHDQNPPKTPTITIG